MSPHPASASGGASSSHTRAGGISGKLPTLIVLALGICFWMLWMAGPVDEEALVPFATACLCVGIASGMHFRSYHPLMLGYGLVLGPTALAPFTASRGDGDGLWILQFGYLGFLGLLCSGVARIGHQLAWRRGGFSQRDQLRFSLPLVLLAAASAVLLVVLRWPDPWSSLEAELDAFHLPHFSVIQTLRGGSALCFQTCGPYLTREFVTGLPQTNACEELERAVRARGVRVDLAQSCYINGELPGGPLGRLVVTGYKADDDPSPRDPARVAITLEATR